VNGGCDQLLARSALPSNRDAEISRRDGAQARELWGNTIPLTARWSINQTKSNTTNIELNAWSVCSSGSAVAQAMRPR